MTKRKELAALRENVELKAAGIQFSGAKYVDTTLMALLYRCADTLRDYENALETVRIFLEHPGHTEGCNYHMAFHDPFDCDCGHAAALTALRKATGKEVER